MRALTWLMRAAVFFVLFAFALNNQDDATIKWFFGREWHAPMVFIVLAAFALGCALGIAAMLPSWWRHRRLAQQQRAPRLDTSPAALDAATSVRGTEPVPLEHPPRDGV
jgi:uncharacterized integral membrane protein